MEITLSAVASGHLLDIHKIPPEMEVRDFERIATLYDLARFDMFPFKRLLEFSY